MVVFPGLGRSGLVGIRLKFGSLDFETRTVPRASQAICHSETEAFLLGSDIRLPRNPSFARRMKMFSTQAYVPRSCPRSNDSTVDYGLQSHHEDRMDTFRKRKTEQRNA